MLYTLISYSLVLKFPSDIIHLFLLLLISIPRALITIIALEMKHLNPVLCKVNPSLIREAGARFPTRPAAVGGWVISPAGLRNVNLDFWAWKGCPSRTSLPSHNVLHCSVNFGTEERAHIWLSSACVIQLLLVISANGREKRKCLGPL